MAAGANPAGERDRGLSCAAGQIENLHVRTGSGIFYKSLRHVTAHRGGLGLKFFRSVEAERGAPVGLCFGIHVTQWVVPKFGCIQFLSPGLAIPWSEM